jgi:hypothetical protein
MSLAAAFEASSFNEHRTPPDRQPVRLDEERSGFRRPLHTLGTTRTRRLARQLRRASLLSRGTRSTHATSLWDSNPVKVLEDIAGF